jgi:uncharacterized membrane protein YsdA (DUF1294 family)
MGVTAWQLHLVWLVLASIVTFVAYGMDKGLSKTGARRIPEKILHGFAILGGFPGGWLGRAVFRHKTRKGIFIFVLIISTLLHAALFFSLFSGL